MLFVLVPILLAQTVIPFEDEGTTVGAANILNCTGAGVSCSLSGRKMTLNIAGGGAASDLTCSECVSSGEILSLDGAKVSSAVATATALAANPTDCGANQYATTIAASGNLTCAQVGYSQLSGTQPAAGADTQFQYNAAGVLSGASKLVRDATTGSAQATEQIHFTDQTTAPTASSSGTVSDFFSFKRGAALPVHRGPFARPQILLGALGGAQRCFWPSSGSVLVEQGVGWTPGTISHPATATTNRLTKMSRTRFSTAATANTGNGVRAATDIVYGEDGFLFWARVGIVTAIDTQRGFYGVWQNNSLIAGSPAAELRTVYIGHESAQTTLRACSNDASGSATCSDLGSNFPVAANAIYDVWIYTAAGASYDYYVERLDSSFVASGTISSDMPETTTGMVPQIYINNGATGGAATLDSTGMCVISDF